jgi:hypothetical protein
MATSKNAFRRQKTTNRQCIKYTIFRGQLKGNGMVQNIEKAADFSPPLM